MILRNVLSQFFIVKLISTTQNPEEAPRPMITKSHNPGLQLQQQFEKAHKSYNTLALGLCIQISVNIVNRAEWLGSPATIKGVNKDAKTYVARSMTVQNLSFCAHTLYMNYVTNKLLLVRLCFVHVQGQKTEQKPTTKKFVEFHKHTPLLTMVSTTYR